MSAEALFLCLIVQQDSAHISKTVAGFQLEDPFGINQQLNEDQRMISNSAAQYAQGKLVPRLRQTYRDEYTDPAIFRDMGNWDCWAQPSKLMAVPG